MLYTKFLEFEKFLDSSKDKAIRVKSLETSILSLKKHAEMRGMNFKEELRYIKIHYQSQLSLSGAMGTIVSVFAIVAAVILGSFSAVSSIMDSITNSIILLATLAYIVLIQRTYKKAVTYTIIINVIDKVIDDA